ncbi:hypothetical protein AB1E18_008804 [Capra hircus]
MCQDLPYNTAFTPNLLNHYDQQTALYPRLLDLNLAGDPTEEASVAVQGDYGFWCPRGLKIDPDLGCSFLHMRDCSPPCPNMYFRREELSFARYFIGLISIICLSATLFTFLTFLIDVVRFHYPERSIIIYAVCYMMVSLIFFIGFLLEDRVACNASSPAQYKASTVTQGSHNKACIMLFMILYIFTMAGSIWWVILAITWFLAAKALLFHASAWGIPGTQTIILLAMNKIEGDNISGMCFVGLYDVDALRYFVLVPLCLYVVDWVSLLLASIVSLNRLRVEIIQWKSQIDSRELQQYMNQEIPDVQAGFRKGRGIRDQIVNIRWITEKARKFQKKASNFCIDDTKAFDCVDNNKLNVNNLRYADDNTLNVRKQRGAKEPPDEGERGKCLILGRKAMTNLDSVLKSRDFANNFANKGLYSQSSGFSTSHVWI